MYVRTSCVRRQQLLLCYRFQSPHLPAPPLAQLLTLVDDSPEKHAPLAAAGVFLLASSIRVARCQYFSRAPSTTCFFAAFASTPWFFPSLTHTHTQQSLTAKGSAFFGGLGLIAVLYCVAWSLGCRSRVREGAPWPLLFVVSHACHTGGGTTFCTRGYRMSS